MLAPLMPDLPEPEWLALLKAEVENPNVARRWIGSRDFAEVCHLAGLNPDWVEREARREMALPRDKRRAELLKISSVSSRAAIQRRHGVRTEVRDA